MRRTREYHGIWLKPEAIKKAFSLFEKSLITDFHKKYLIQSLETDISGAFWEHDSEEAFFEAYRPGVSNATYKKTFLDYEFMVRVLGNVTYVGIKAQNLRQIEALFDALEKLIPMYSLPQPGTLEPPPPIVFICHGPGHQWQQLADYLMRQHGYHVRAFDWVSDSVAAHWGNRVGDGPQDGMAAFVITEEDIPDEQTRLFTERVMHASGFLMAHLGGNRVFFLMEGDHLDFPEIQGTREIRYRKGHIRESFWKVLDILHREYPRHGSA